MLFIHRSFLHFFAVVASFGIGNMTQGNSISGALKATFNVPTWLSGIIITVFALLIIVGGIKSISKVSSVVVPVMAIFYVICGLIVIIGNISNLPRSIPILKTILEMLLNKLLKRYYK